MGNTSSAPDLTPYATTASVNTDLSAYTTTQNLPSYLTSQNFIRGDLTNSQLQYIASEFESNQNAMSKVTSDLATTLTSAPYKSQITGPQGPQGPAGIPAEVNAEAVTNIIKQNAVWCANGTCTGVGQLNVTGEAPISSQGSYLQWNRKNWPTSGQTFLVNEPGTGTGGISFGQSDASDKYSEWAYLDNGGNLTVNGRTNATDVRAGGNSSTASQGAYLQWNRNGGLGQTNIINNRGLGPGGITFGSSDTSNKYTEWGAFDSSGNFNVNNTLNVGNGVGNYSIFGDGNALFIKKNNTGRTYIINFTNQSAYYTG